MIQISLKKLRGNWVDGFALDYHTISSTFLGYDEFGHRRFENTRSELGELLYRLKYNDDRSVIESIVTTAVNFLKTKAWNIDLIIPVLPSRERKYQPVFNLAELIAGELKKPFNRSCLQKVKDIPELKDIYDFDKRIEMLSGAFKIDSSVVKNKNVLLFDDLYRSGATMNAISSELKAAGSADVYVFALTKTRSKR